MWWKFKKNQNSYSKHVADISSFMGCGVTHLIPKTQDRHKNVFDQYHL